MNTINIEIVRRLIAAVKLGRRTRFPRQGAEGGCVDVVQLWSPALSDILIHLPGRSIDCQLEWDGIV